MVPQTISPVFLKAFPVTTCLRVLPTLLHDNFTGFTLITVYFWFFPQFFHSSRVASIRIWYQEKYDNEALTYAMYIFFIG